MNYHEFIDSKSQSDRYAGFDPIWMPSFLFDFQSMLVDWAVRKGKCAIFADCGLGKTPMQLVWAENVIRKTGRPVLILTPLAVSHQTIAEGEKFGIEVRRSQTGEVYAGINVTNYERLHYFKPDDFAGCVCDESSAIKCFDGKRRAQVTEFMRRMDYRLLCTATAAPNDYIELGTSSEALGELGHIDMLNRFFKNDQNTVDTRRRWRGHSGIEMSEGRQWRFKGHAEVPFWKWVCSWARAIRRPSDMGFDDDGFMLPPLIEQTHCVVAQKLANGYLFPLPAVGLKEQREERRRTITERCEKVAEIVSDTGQQALVWCHLNAEGNLLRQCIPDSVEVAGSDSDDTKEKALIDFAIGRIRVLVTKPKIGAWGLNFQNCSHVTFFPSHSFEQYYQGTRRCWRFGQKNPVVVDVIETEGERDVVVNLKRKQKAADEMFTRLVSHMNDALSVSRGSNGHIAEVIPSWL